MNLMAEMRMASGVVASAVGGGAFLGDGGGSVYVST